MVAPFQVSQVYTMEILGLLEFTSLPEQLYPAYGIPSYMEFGKSFHK
jgi:hypothetical protein